jgi:hypothetical protein
VNCPLIFTVPAPQDTSAGLTSNATDGVPAFGADDALVAGMGAITSKVANTTAITPTDRSRERDANIDDFTASTPTGRERCSPNCQNRTIRNPRICGEQPKVMARPITLHLITGVRNRYGSQESIMQPTFDHPIDPERAFSE